VASTAKSSGAPEYRPAPIASRSGQHSILVVEDNIDTREALATLLALQGFDVVDASNGAEALAYLRAGYAPCVIVLDVMMPGCDGYEFRDQQVRVPAFAAIPVVMLSGAGRLEERAAELGIRDYLAKPIQADRLLEMIARYCRGQQAAG
jgi:CheY-like chemotaxis protein